MALLFSEIDIHQVLLQSIQNAIPDAYFAQIQMIMCYLIQVLLALSMYFNTLEHQI